MRAFPSSDRPTAGLLDAYSANAAQALTLKRAKQEASRARDEAARSVKARSGFLANMNHEMRTPLNAIIGFAAMLKDEEEYNLAQEQRTEYAQYILQSADLLLAHVNTALEAADIDNGNIALDKENVDLKALLAESVERLQIASVAAGVAIELHQTSESEIIIWGDQNRLRQAVDHLLRASLRMSKDSQNVVARVARDENGAPEIAIRHFGDGLSQEELTEALSAFDDAHYGLGRSFDGPGVELAIAKYMIEMHGGEFIVKTKPGKGALMRAILPLEQEG